jgi:alanine racemase
MCVLKSNGYGHGAAALAERLEKEGCDAFGTASLDEGIELRRAGASSCILILSHICTERIDEALENRITLTVFSVEMAECISAAAKTKGINAEVHVKIDTGMTRIGFNTDEAFEAIKYINTLPNIIIDGIYTHFACADEWDRTYTDMQVNKLNALLAELENAGIKIKVRHAANSAAGIMLPETHYDMIRLGISLYGCYPSDEVDKSRIILKQAMELKTQIIRINDVDEGVSVSYNNLFITKRKTRIATMPAGYGDGLKRLMLGKLTVLINGQAAPVIGRICMDQCMADITDITGDVKINDEVVSGGKLRRRAGGHAGNHRLRSRMRHWETGAEGVYKCQ